MPRESGAWGQRRLHDRSYTLESTGSPAYADDDGTDYIAFTVLSVIFSALPSDIMYFSIKILDRARRPQGERATLSVRPSQVIGCGRMVRDVT